MREAVGQWAAEPATGDSDNGKSEGTSATKKQKNEPEKSGSTPVLSHTREL